jgi:predicted transcriptional regulator
MKSSMEGLNAENFMSAKIAKLSPQDTLYKIYHLFNKDGLAIGVVVDDAKIVGVLDREIISKLISNN